MTGARLSGDLALVVCPAGTVRVSPVRAVALACAVVLAGAAGVAHAADLQPRTVAAFELYAKETERRIDGEVQSTARFLWVDGLPDLERQNALAALRRGEIVIDKLTTTENGRAIAIPDGLVHHWVGLAFLPGVRLDAALALLQNYDRHGEIYRPRIERSELRARDGDRYRFFLRFFMKKVITVVINSEHEATYTRPAPDRAYSRVVSTRMAEVENPGARDEREKPIGRDGGYLWRLNTYWRFLERDGGVYLHCESISLTRGIPIGLGWVVGPFVNSLPRESLEFTMETTRKTLTAQPAR